MKALVTGANGFTGSHLVKALNQRGDQVVGLVRQTSDLSRLQDAEIELVYGDICDRDSLLKAMTDVDTVFHIAAYVELGLVNEAYMERVNVEGTRNVLEVAQSLQMELGKPTKLVYCSTIGIYGDTQGQTIDETFQRTQTNYSSAYDRTKLQAQQLVDQAARNGLPIVSLMPSGILGSDDPHFGPAVQLFLKGWMKFWPGGDRVTGVVHVDDLVSAMLLAADKAPAGEHYIISAGDLTTREMFQLLSREAGIPAPKDPPEAVVRLVGNVLDPIGRAFKWNPPIGRERVHYIYDRCVRVDANKARRELGWQPRSVEALLQQIVKEMQAAQTTSKAKG